MGSKSIALYTGAFGAGALSVLGFMAVSGALSSERSTVTQPATASNVVAESEGERSPQGKPEREGPPENFGGDGERLGELPAASTSIADLQRNTRVTVQGTVDRVTDEDEFIVSDSTGAVPVWTGTTFFTVNPGETVSVTGFIDDDAPLEVYAEQITRADGSVVEVTGVGGPAGL